MFCLISGLSPECWIKRLREHSFQESPPFCSNTEKSLQQIGKKQIILCPNIWVVIIKDFQFHTIDHEYLHQSIPFTGVTFAVFIIFSKKPISVVTRDFFSRLNISQSFHTCCISARWYKLEKEMIGRGKKGQSLRLHSIWVWNKSKTGGGEKLEGQRNKKWGTLLIYL